MLRLSANDSPENLSLRDFARVFIAHWKVTPCSFTHTVLRSLSSARSFSLPVFSLLPNFRFYVDRQCPPVRGVLWVFFYTEWKIKLFFSLFFYTTNWKPRKFDDFAFFPLPRARRTLAIISSTILEIRRVSRVRHCSIIEIAVIHDNLRVFDPQTLDFKSFIVSG